MARSDRQRVKDVKKMLRSIRLDYCGHEDHSVYEDGHEAKRCPGRWLDRALGSLGRFDTSDFRRDEGLDNG